MPLFAYSLKEGLASLRRAKFATFTATSAMAVALVLIGVFALLSYEAQLVSDWLRQRVGEMDVFLEENVTEAQAEALHRRIQAWDGVSEARYISREEAMAIFQQDFGEGAEVFLDEPFLPPSIKVRVTASYADPDSLARLAAQFNTWTHVDEAIFNRPILVTVQENLQLLTAVGLSLGALVVLASIFLVANTIRLTIYARRLLIRTMKLVGATNSFIRRPFIIEGLVQGLLGGLFAVPILWGLYVLLVENLPAARLQHEWGTAILLGSILLGGMLLGLLGSFFAVRRFIKKVALH